MSEQLALASLLADADQRAHERRDFRRNRVQAWFDGLPEEQKRQLGEWMTDNEWDTCSALSVAACDHHMDQRRDRR